MIQTQKLSPRAILALAGAPKSTRPTANSKEFVVGKAFTPLGGPTGHKAAGQKRATTRFGRLDQREIAPGIEPDTDGESDCGAGEKESRRGPSS